MQVAAGGPSGGPDPGNGFAGDHGVSAADGNGRQMVVGRDESVAVIDLDPVAATPGMPARGTDHARVSREHLRAARRRKVLAEVEITCCSKQRTYPEAKGRGRSQLLEGSHQETRRRPAHPCQLHVQGWRGFLTGAADQRTRKSDLNLRIAQDRRGQRAGNKAVQGWSGSLRAFVPIRSSARTGTSRNPHGTHACAGTADGGRDGPCFGCRGGRVYSPDSHGQHPAGGRSPHRGQAQPSGACGVLPGYRVIAHEPDSRTWPAAPVMTVSPMGTYGPGRWEPCSGTLRVFCGCPLSSRCRQPVRARTRTGWVVLTISPRAGFPTGSVQHEEHPESPQEAPRPDVQ
jgi:hypothetical protein